MAQRRDERRDLDQTFGLAWRVLSTLPRHELSMLDPDTVSAHYQETA